MIVKCDTLFWELPSPGDWILGKRVSIIFSKDEFVKFKVVVCKHLPLDFRSYPFFFICGRSLET